MKYSWFLLLGALLVATPANANHFSAGDTIGATTFCTSINDVESLKAATTEKELEYIWTKLVEKEQCFLLAEPLPVMMMEYIETFEDPYGREFEIYKIIDMAKDYFYVFLLTREA